MRWLVVWASGSLLLIGEFPLIEAPRYLLWLLFRWGLGRTEPRSKSAKGIMQWASVVEEVLDLLRIDQCSIMAHSAGAPYALSFANKLPSRIRGDICLLAPWVGGSESSEDYILQFLLL